MELFQPINRQSYTLFEKYCGFVTKILDLHVLILPYKRQLNGRPIAKEGIILTSAK
jgi:hypothetical protein